MLYRLTIVGARKSIEVEVGGEWKTKGKLKNKIVYILEMLSKGSYEEILSEQKQGRTNVVNPSDDYDDLCLFVSYGIKVRFVVCAFRCFIPCTASMEKVQ